MATDLVQERVPGAAPSAPEGLVVGDLHLENFGTYRGTSGALCFDVNDFDEVAPGPLDLDLKRLCTSAMLLPGIEYGSRLTAATLIGSAWAEGVERLGGRFPISVWGLDKAEGWLQQLLREKGRRTRADLVAKVAPGKGRRRFGEDGDPPKFAHAKQPWPELVEAALGEYYDHLKQLKADVPEKDWEPVDVAYRFKGTGPWAGCASPCCSRAARSPQDRRRSFEDSVSPPAFRSLDRAVRRTPLRTFRCPCGSLPRQPSRETGGRKRCSYPEIEGRIAHRSGRKEGWLPAD